MEMRLGSNILWVEDFKLKKVLMTSSSFRFYDVIIILMSPDSEKSGRFLKAFVVFKNGFTDFSKLMAF